MSYDQSTAQFISLLFPYLNTVYINQLLLEYKSFTEIFNFIEEMIEFKIKWIYSNNVYKYSREIINFNESIYKTYRNELKNFRVKDLVELDSEYGPDLGPYVFNQELANEIELIANKYIISNRFEC